MALTSQGPKTEKIPINRLRSNAPAAQSIPRRLLSVHRRTNAGFWDNRYATLEKYDLESIWLLMHHG